MPRYKAWIEGADDFDVIEAIDFVTAVVEFSAGQEISVAVKEWEEEREENRQWKAYTLQRWKGLRGGAQIFFRITDEIGKIKPTVEDRALYNQYPQDEYEEGDA